MQVSRNSERAGMTSIVHVRHRINLCLVDKHLPQTDVANDNESSNKNKSSVTLLHFEQQQHAESIKSLREKNFFKSPCAIRQVTLLPSACLRNTSVA
jgi:hypothetical protein